MPKLKRKYRPGKCYTNCFLWAIEHRERHEALRIVHGRVWWPAENRYISHAWIEWTDTVIEPLTGHEIPRGDYYRLHRVDERETARYTYRQACVEYARSNHFGPWHAGLVVD